MSNGCLKKIENANDLHLWLCTVRSVTLGSLLLGDALDGLEVRDQVDLVGAHVAEEDRFAPSLEQKKLIKRLEDVQRGLRAEGGRRETFAWLEGRKLRVLSLFNNTIRSSWRGDM